ncbi:MAG: hypothetical protein AAF333_13100 [Planctomycetota bacterium]
MLGMSFPRLALVTILLSGAATLGGCAGLTAVNPSFDTSYAEARSQLKAMRQDKKSLERPLIFIGPFLDPFVAEWLALSHIKKYVDNPAQTAGVSFVLWDTFDTCRAKTIAEVDRRFPTDDPEQTVEVDVVAFSMGGVVARYAALPPDAERGQSRRLKVRRMFTVASPHRGANWAPLGFWNSLARDMEAGSALLQRLDAGLEHASYELVPYTRLDDWVVGPTNTAPRGVTPHWVSARPFEMAHVQAASDARIRADILRRLRHETPLTDGEPAPFPGGDR